MCLWYTVTKKYIKYIKNIELLTALFLAYNFMLNWVHEIAEMENCISCVYSPNIKGSSSFLSG